MTGPIHGFVFATGNAHKVGEVRRIVQSVAPALEVLAYDGPSPVEDGDTFEANALIKARAAVRHTGLPSVADDSGIEVAALAGAPGIYSARYASSGLDADNRALLLERTAGVADRRARFVCAVALVTPAGEERTWRAVWPGELLTAERGDGGFGYDPIFLPDGERRSAAELLPEEKNAVSHRGQAFRALAAALTIRTP